MGLMNFGKKTVAIALSAQLLIATQTATMAEAQMLSTDQVVSKYAALDDRAALLDALARDDVQAQMIEMGVDPAEAEARLAALTDAEIATIMAQMEADNAGADILGILFTIFVILLVTDLLCFTRFFNFTRCIR